MPATIMLPRCPRESDDVPCQTEERARHCLAHDLLAAQEGERQRIAADLHDGIGQQLSAIKFSLEGALRGLVDRLTPAERDGFDNLLARVSETISEARRISMDLRPPILDDFGVTYAVEWLCGELNRVYTGMAIAADLRADEAAIPAAIKIALFRILQEASNNACKHSGADRVAVRLYTDAEGIRLQVSDNGVGFDPRAARRARGGFGLRSMRERAFSTGGRLSIQSTPGQGATVFAHWPTQELL